ncbi:MAG: peptidase M28, partial [Brevundimonas sp.]
MLPIRRLALTSVAASLLLAACATPGEPAAPAAPAVPAFQAQLLEDVRILASEEMAGRDTGSA